MNSKTPAAVLFVFLWAASAASVALNHAPAPVPASAPPAEFSAERAMAHEFAIAQRPHPVGTPEHDRVRDYLVAKLTELGVSPQIQKATGVTPKYQVAGTVENIVARLKGTNDSTDVVMLAAHYDSVPAGPGAGDDGAGVAALLETLRALRAGPPLRNDVLFVITDGEEDGLLGASAFMAEHPWARDVRVALNFEARGNAGVSQMFETSAGNGRLVQLLADAAPNPAGSSLTYEIYKHMPNDTDLTVFKQSASAGMNFAFIGNWEAYHTPLDNPQQLDRGSLQHHGSNALSLARQFGNADLGNLRERDAVYFSVPGGLFAHYLQNRIWLLAVLGVLVFLAAHLYLGGAGEVSVLRVLLSCLANLGAALFLALAGFGFVKLVTWLHLRWLPEGDVLQSRFYLLSLSALLAALWITLYRLLRKKLSVGNLALGGGLGFLVLTVLMTKWLPGGSYVFLWPLLALLVAACVIGIARLSPPSLVTTVALCLLALPALLILVPLVQGFFQALGLTMMGAPLLSFLVALCLTALTPQIEAILVSWRSSLVWLALAAGILFLGIGASVTRYGNEHPKPSLMAYALDTDSGKALWASSADRVDAWTAQYVSATPSRGKLAGFFPDWLPFEFLQHEAPLLPLAPPKIEVLASSAEGDVRTLLLRITSPRHARTLSVNALENEVLDAAVNGRALGKPAQSRWNPSGKWSFNYAGVPPEGIDLKLLVKGTGPVKLRALDGSMGLPENSGKNFAPRPPDSMPRHSGDETLVRRSFVL